MLCNCDHECSFRDTKDIHFARKNLPEMLRASQRTTTIFWPFSSCFATVLAKRPKRCPLPSITTCMEALVSGCFDLRDCLLSCAGWRNGVPRDRRKTSWITTPQELFVKPRIVEETTSSSSSVVVVEVDRMSSSQRFECGYQACGV